MKSKGLYNKFKEIKRVDGQSEPGQKHHGCNYFTLDLTHDKHAIPAMLAYADSCEQDYPHLAKDIRVMVTENQQRDHKF